MKRLLPLLAALALPSAVNAESYNAGVAKIQYPKIQPLTWNAFKFASIGILIQLVAKSQTLEL